MSPRVDGESSPQVNLECNRKITYGEFIFQARRLDVPVRLPGLTAGASGFSGNCETAALANRAPTDIASASSSGLPARQYPQPFGADIPCRVDVPIMARLTLGARPRPNIERHTFANEATGRKRIHPP
jgi:hypothetical protein